MPPSFLRPTASIALFVVAACSSKQDLGGGSGKSKPGETCSNSSDCADNLRCLDSKCGGQGGDVAVGGAMEPSSCNSDETCKLRGSSAPYCKNGGGCVACLTDEHCAGGILGDHCKVRESPQERNSCVECLTDAHCTDPRAPRCSEGEYGSFCEECLVDADCKDPVERRCKATRSGPTSQVNGSCVECLTNADCKDVSKPICRTSRCAEP